MGTLTLVAAPVWGEGHATHKPVQYNVGGVTLESRFVTVEREGKQPGLLIVPNWMGPREYFFEMGAKWANEGFVVLVVDMYGVDVRPKNAQEAGQAAGGIYAKPDQFRARITKALELLEAHDAVDPERIAAFGFCFGGRTVLELARTGADVQGVISFHGALKPVDPKATPDFKAEVVALHGDVDPYVPDEEEAAFKDELRAHEAEWTFISFGNTVHSFTNPEANMPGAAMYSPEVAAQSWEIADEYLEKWCEPEGEEDDDDVARAEPRDFPRELTVSVPPEGMWFVEDVPVPPLADTPHASLSAYLAQLQALSQEPLTVILAVDKEMQFREVQRMMGAVKQAGIETVQLRLAQFRLGGSGTGQLKGAISFVDPSNAGFDLQYKRSSPLPRAADEDGRRAESATSVQAAVLTITSDGLMQLDGVDLRLSDDPYFRALTEQLKTIRLAASDEEKALALQIRAASNTPNRYLVQAMDAAARAGVERVTLQSTL
ncbi:MAG: dienelactone hydrolase family protein [Opitutales bacterium]